MATDKKASSKKDNLKKVTLGLPCGYKTMLQDLTIDTLKKQPKNAVEHAAKYFNDLKQNMETEKPLIRVGSNITIKMVPTDYAPKQDVPLTMDDDDDDMLETIPPPRTARRKSVACERFNPDEINYDDMKVCYPKSDHQRERLKSVCKDILLFRNLASDEMSDIIDAMFQKCVKKDEKVIVQGQEGDNFYVIEQGTYDVYRADEEVSNAKPVKVNEYNGSGSFGELSLMYHAPRAATVVATSSGVLWCLDRNTFRRLVLTKAYEKRMEYEKFLNSIPLLSELNSYERMNVADALKTVTFENGETIFKQGDEGNELYFIEQGEVKITYEDPKTHTLTHLTTLRQGDYFGELALVTQNPRAASASTVGHTRLASLDVNSFERLLGSCIDVMKRNISTYKNQMQKALNGAANCA